MSKMKEINYRHSQGCVGISDKYWLTALIPDQGNMVDINFKYYLKDTKNKYQTDFSGNNVIINAGESHTNESLVFAGAKKVALLDKYAEKYNIELFDRAVDFGILYFMTKPIFLALKYLYNILGNFGLAIIALTIMIRILLFPLANKSFKAISRMRGLHPKIMQIRENFKEDKQQMQKEIMKLYRTEKINPAAGCLPILVQIPIFFALYKVLFITIEMRHAPFYGWIYDLSAPDPTSIFNLFGL